MSNPDALLNAIRSRDTDAVRTLLDENPDLARARNDAGPSPLLMALYVQADDLVAVLRDYGAVPNLFEAAALGDADRIRLLLDADPEGLHALNPEGWTPLHLASFFGHPAAVDALLARGADVHAVSTNDMRNTPLHAAIAGRRNRSVIDRLLEENADPNAEGAGGITPLHLAASRGDTAVIDLLYAHGARSTRTDDGQSPADLAVARDHPDAAAHLEELAAH